MARFSRLRRSAGLLLLASGFCGFPANSTWAQEIRGSVGTDGLERIGVDFDVARQPGALSTPLTPQIIIIEEENDRLLGISDAEPVAPQTLPALILAQGAEGVRKFFGIPSTPADVAAATAEQATAARDQAQPEKPFSLEKILTLEMEVTPLQEAGIVAKDGPVLRMSAQTQERMMRHFAPAADPVPESGIEPIGDDFVQHLPPRDDVPLENPPAVAARRAVSPTMSPLEYAETFLTQDERNNLPIGTVMLQSEHSALTGRIAGIESEDDSVIVITRRIPQDEHVQQTAHAEPIATPEPSKACLSPLLRALGGPLNVTECESETCHGWLFQFGTPAPPAAVAEAQAFDGPAQITLHDGPHTPGQGFVWPAQPAGTLTQPAGTLTLPVAHTETLDELADRLEREFLHRAVSGQIQIPAACPAVDHEAACKEAACKSGICSPCQPEKCQSEKCQSASNTCQPGQCLTDKCPSDKSLADKCPPCGLADCPGCPAGSPCDACCPAIVVSPNMMSYPAPTAGFPTFSPRSQWTLPTPAVTVNPYAQTSPIPGPGAGMMLPRDFEFYARSPEVPAGPPTCGPQVCTVPSTFAPAYPPLAPQVAMVSQPWPAEWVPANSPAPGACACPSPATYAGPSTCAGPSPASGKTPVSGEALETHREISRTLEQLAERCESQGLYAQADELRGQAQEFRMRARVIHGHLAALPPAHPMYGQMPPPAYGTLPLPYAVPSMYIPEPAPSLSPPPSPLVPAGYPQPLPIAQPMVVPRY